VGFKNATSGDVQVAIDAVQSAAHPHCFLGVTKNGQSAIFGTKGNPNCHVILRGGKGTRNYEAASVSQISAQLEKAGLPARLMIDCSHANSNKKHDAQVAVCRDILGQIKKGDRRIVALMIESNLVEGAQPFAPGKKLVYGQSITDACISWETTLGLLRECAEAVRSSR
jgi:3-deoxy-7-phosphoheptulonate synthase